MVLKILSQDVLGDAGVEAANVESALVGLGGGAPAEKACCDGRGVL